jgi:hypothetical protein
VKCPDVLICTGNSLCIPLQHGIFTHRYMFVVSVMYGQSVSCDLRISTTLKFVNPMLWLIYSI